MSAAQVEVWAPGRVNLVGDHTDYSGGLAMPMAIQLGTTIEGRSGGDVVRLTSDQLGSSIEVPIGIRDPATVEPSWGRYVAGVVAEVGPAEGFVGTVGSDLPIGAGLSSSASLEVAVALALGTELEPLELAELCQRAEQVASGVPCGIMDQLTVVAGVEGHALALDCGELTWRPVPVPDDASIVVIDSGQPRELAGSAYATRRAQCEAAAAIIGPLARATLDDVGRIDDALLRKRARHVVTENRRVRDVAAAFVADDLEAVGELMVASHESLRADFDVSTPVLDDLVADLLARPGVLGARLTGAGFGGCVVALTHPGTELDGWVVRPSAGAHRR